MRPEEVRKIIDLARKWQKDNHGKYSNGSEFWNAFFANLFVILYTNIKK